MLIQNQPSNLSDQLGGNAGRGITEKCTWPNKTSTCKLDQIKNLVQSQIQIDAT